MANPDEKELPVISTTSILDGFKMAEAKVKKLEETAVAKIETEFKKEVEQAKNEGVGLLDVISEKVISRKFLVWICACAFLGFNKLTPDQWVAISLGYIGVQGFADLAAKWKGN
jgi:hypothetical protein